MPRTKLGYSLIVDFSGKLKGFYSVRLNRKLAEATGVLIKLASRSIIESSLIPLMLLMLQERVKTGEQLARQPSGVTEP